MKRPFLTLACLLFLVPLFSQQNLKYQKPPEEILELVDVVMPPDVEVDSKGEILIFFYEDPFVSIAELSEPELRLAGLRINPLTNIGSRTRYYKDIAIKNPKNGELVKVSGLPENARIAYESLSPDEKTLAFTHTSSKGVELWKVDLSTGKAARLTSPILNANIGRPFIWLKDNSGFLVKVIPPDRKDLIDRSIAVPEGPVVSVSKGEKAQNRTYQDLLKNPDDEFNFEQLTRAEIARVDLDGGKSKWLPADMYTGLVISPDGEYVLVTRISRPFSYLVPFYRFPNQYIIYNKDGEKIRVFYERELMEVIPKGFDAEMTGKRDIDWRNDRPSTLYWVEALDGGDPAAKVEFRDQLYELDEPFDGNPRALLKTRNRFRRVRWGNENVAVAYDRWWLDRNEKIYLFSPSDPGMEPKIFADRNYQDSYNHPGDFVTSKNEYEEYVLETYKNNLYLVGDGFSEQGQFPFIDELNLKSLSKKRLYESPYTDKFENIRDIISIREGKILVSLESKNEYPNYYIRTIKKPVSFEQLTYFENPYQSLENVHKEVIKYKRKDGLELDAILYLPPGYDMQKKEKLPLLLWAYPREYKDRSSASQNTSNPNRFISPSYGSPIFWVTRGYAILDNAAFPIVGEGDTEPNDSFREQLVANAAAAIDAVDQLGYIDRNRVGVGGHSYGAFMVANLLSHSDLFAAGIARSGAYNRTLTPFGFQSEHRSYWDSPETYYTMSPFMHADKMKTPLLLIHGEADNNSGTYPLQSERYFNALKGLGATVRLVMLPKESHGYRARESILHMLWEQDQWLETYVKQSD